MARALSLFALVLAGCVPEPAAPPKPLPPAMHIQVAAPAAAPETVDEPPEPATPVPIASTAPPAPPPAWTGPPLDLVRDQRPHAQRRYARAPRGPVAWHAGPVPLDLETLLASLPRTNADRPGHLQYLGAAYSDFAVLAQQAGRPEVVTEARRKSIAYYGMLSSQYPQPCPAGASTYDPCPDEALYYLGLEQERAGDLDGARKSYLSLLSGHPQSPFIPGAHVAFGEMFLAESASDPSKVPPAVRSYEQALKYPPPANFVYGYAQHQLGRAHAQEGQRARAEASFKAALAWAAAYPYAPGASDIGPSAQRELLALKMP